MPQEAGLGRSSLLEERVVGIHLAYPGGQRLATGMLVAGDLVMTALHTFVRRRQDGSCAYAGPDLPSGWEINVAVVRLADRLGGTSRTVQWHAAEILWPTHPPLTWAACDIALLSIKGVAFRVEPLAITVPPPHRMALAARFNGFPLAIGGSGEAQRVENVPGPVDPDTHFLNAIADYAGDLTIHDKAVNRRIMTIMVGGDAPPGISGSVVLHEENPDATSIVGVVSAASSPSYTELMETLGRTRKSVTIALLAHAVEEDEELAGLLAARGVAPAAPAAPAALPVLGDYAVLIDRRQTCEGVAASLFRQAGAAGAAAPRAVLSLGYVGEDDPYRAIRAIASRLPEALKDVFGRRAPAPPVYIEQKPLLMRVRPPARLLRSDINALVSHLEGGLGSGPGVVVVPFIVAGEIQGPKEAAFCRREIEGLLKELTPFAAPLALLAFVERETEAASGEAVHDRLCAGAAEMAAAFPPVDFMGDLEWIDEHAIADWGMTLMRMPDLTRWSHLVSPRIDALGDRVFRLYASGPEGAKAYPRLRRVVELIAEIQTSLFRTPP